VTSITSSNLQNIIVSGDKNGLILVWSLQFSSFFHLQTFGAKSKGIHILACHPVQRELVAAGLTTVGTFLMRLDIRQEKS